METDLYACWAYAIDLCEPDDIRNVNRAGLRASLFCPYQAPASADGEETRLWRLWGYIGLKGGSTRATMTKLMPRAALWPVPSAWSDLTPTGAFQEFFAAFAPFPYDGSLVEPERPATPSLSCAEELSESLGG